MQIQNFKLHFFFFSLICPQYSRFLKLRQRSGRGGGSRRQGISISRSMPTYFRASAWLYLEGQEREEWPQAPEVRPAQPHAYTSEGVKTSAEATGAAIVTGEIPKKAARLWTEETWTYSPATAQEGRSTPCSLGLMLGRAQSHWPGGPSCASFRWGGRGECFKGLSGGDLPPKLCV